MPLLKLYLHGHLRHFSRPVQLHACHAAEAVSALCQQIDGFEACIRKGRFEMIAGPQRTGRRLSGPACYQPVPEGRLHIMPLAAGAANSSLQGVLGLTLLGLSFVPGLGGLAATGLSPQLVGQVGGLLMLNSLRRRPQSPATEYQDSAPSDLLPTPKSSAEGQPIPLLYGQHHLQNPPIIYSGLSVDIETL